MNNTDRSIHKIVILVILNSNQHENKWICEAETSDEVYICKIHSGLDNKFPHFTCMVKVPLFAKSDILFVRYTQSLHQIKNYIDEHRNYHSWFILETEQQ